MRKLKHVVSFIMIFCLCIVAVPIIAAEPAPAPAPIAVLAELSDHVGVIRTDTATGNVTLFLWPGHDPTNKVQFAARKGFLEINRGNVVQRLPANKIRSVFLFKTQPSLAEIDRLYQHQEISTKNPTAAKLPAWAAYARQNWHKANPMEGFIER